MDAEFTAKTFNTYLKDLGNDDSGSTFCMSKACAFGAIRLQLDINPPSQETLDECLLIGLRNLATQSQHISHVVAALQLLLQFGAKWNGSTLFDILITPYHIICHCSSDPYELLDMMIKSSGGKLMNKTDSSGCTAVMYAVHYKNVECLRCLIDQGADLNLGSDYGNNNMTTPLIDAIRAYSSSRSPISRDILNLLLENGVDVNKSCYLRRSPIEYAIDCNSIYCAKKIILNGAQLNFVSEWFPIAASKTSIDMLRYLIDFGIDKNCTDLLGKNVLYHAISSGDITVIRYLLEAGVTISTIKKQPDFHMMYMQQDPLQWNSCLQAISLEKLDVVQLLEKYDQQSFQSFEALQCAVRKSSLEMVNYLLSKYKYPINMEYLSWRGHTYHTILTEACHPYQLEMVSLLMEYGADPAKKSVHKQYQSAFLKAIDNEYNELVAHFIRSGVSLDGRLHDDFHGAVLPFEYAVIKHNKPATEMILYGGCGNLKLIKNFIAGIYCFDTTYDFRRYVSQELQKLMRELDVLENNVKSLQLLCRKSILKHLCPRAVKKITKLPLPPMIIRFLSIPEINHVLDEFKKNQPRIPSICVAR